MNRIRLICLIVSVMFLGGCAASLPKTVAREDVVEALSENYRANIVISSHETENAGTLERKGGAVYTVGVSLAGAWFYYNADMGELSTEFEGIKKQHGQASSMDGVAAVFLMNCLREITLKEGAEFAGAENDYQFTGFANGIEFVMIIDGESGLPKKLMSRDNKITIDFIEFTYT